MPAKNRKAPKKLTVFTTTTTPAKPKDKGRPASITKAAVSALRVLLERICNVPIISWASAGKGGNYHDLEDYLDEQIKSDCPDPNAYGLIIEGDSMETEFKRGDRIVVSPGAEAQNGDVVVARLAKDGGVLFKVMHLSGKNLQTVRLTSYNPAYPPLEFQKREFRFIHPVFSMLRRIRGQR